MAPWPPTWPAPHVRPLLATWVPRAGSPGPPGLQEDPDPRPREPVPGTAQLGVGFADARTSCLGARGGGVAGTPPTPVWRGLTPRRPEPQGRVRLAQLGDPPETHTLTSGGRPVTESPEGLASCGGSSLRARRCLRGGLLSAASRLAQSPEARRLRHAGRWVLAVYAPERSVGSSGLQLRPGFTSWGLMTGEFTTGWGFTTGPPV